MAMGAAGAGSDLTSRALGQWMTPATTPKGEEEHTLTIPEMPAHTHSQVAADEPHPGIWDHVAGDSWSFLSPYTTGSTGADGAHNNMQPTTFLNWVIKL
jgi:microcystin-dependent protein